MSRVASAVAVGVLPLVLGMGSGWLGRVPRDWYDGLQKPAFSPPPWVFGVVWPILYVLIGVAAVLALLNETAPVWGWVVFALGLLCNILFSPVNFRAKSLVGGAILTTLTWIFSVLLVVLWRSNTVAVGCLVPYIAWLSFATVLAWTFVSKNSQHFL